MKLHFLGHTYTSSLNRIHTQTTEKIGYFRGQTYFLRRSAVDYDKSSLGLKSSGIQILKYRGVVYSV